MAKYKWLYDGEEPVTVKNFLKDLGFGHRLIADLKHGGGRFRIGQHKLGTKDLIAPGDLFELWTSKDAGDPDVQVSNEPIEVVFEDDNWLIVNKPAGLSSIPGPTNQTDTLLNRVKGYLVKQGAEDRRPHLIIRLDRFTSGIMLIAKNRIGQSLIAPQVEQRQVEKRYIAIASGQFDSEHDTIDMPIDRVGDSPRREVVADGKNAVTEYWVKRQGADWTELEVQLHTGRTHQIRVHLTEEGHPLLGDELYGGPMDLIQRQALHASSLAFVDPFTNRYLEFMAPIPTDMQRILG